MLFEMQFEVSIYHLSFTHHIFTNLHWATWGDSGEHFMQSFFHDLLRQGRDRDREFREWRDEDRERSQREFREWHN